MDNKTRYRQFCKTEKELPLFFQGWYLDAVSTEGKWDVVLLLEEKQVIAALPYFQKRKAIFHYLTMPHLCFQMGPYVVASHRDQLEQLLDKLIAQLPKFDLVEQRWHYSISNLLRLNSGQVSANLESSFQFTQRYSYCIESLGNLTKVYKKICSDYRNNKIKKARELVTIQHNLPVEEFYRINKMTFDRQGIEMPYSLDFLKRLDEACAKYKARKILYAIDQQQQIHSVLYLVWDRVSSYMLMAGDDPELRKSGAGILLTWEAIQYTKEVLHLDIFDFEGSMIPSIERVRKNFGATRKYYWQVNKTGSQLFKIASKLKKGI